MLNTLITTHSGREAGDLQMMEDLQGETEAETQLKYSKQKWNFKKTQKPSVSASLKVTRVKVRHPEEKRVSVCERHTERENQTDKGCVTVG